MARLRRAWQTRVYLIVLAEGGAALVPEKPEAFVPDHLSFTYWYVEDPDHPRVIDYSEANHRRNLSELETIVAEIDRQLTELHRSGSDHYGYRRRPIVFVAHARS